MIRVLLVDDEYYFRQAIKQLVDWHALGFEIVGEVNNGVDALKKIPEVDLVLLDINIPIILGLDVLRECIERNYQAKVIIVTVYSEFSYIKTAMALGAIDYILKPVSADELIRVLTKAKAIYTREQEFLHATFPLGQLHSNAFQSCCGDFFTEDSKIIQGQSVSIAKRVELLRLLRAGDTDGIRQYLDRLMKAKSYTPINLYILLFELLSSYSEFCLEVGHPFPFDNKCTEAQNIVIHAQSIEEVITWIYEQAEVIIDSMINEKTPSAKNVQTVEAIREYIREHYMDQDLRLNKIANHFFLNYQYLSKMFSQQTNSTINAYITQIRLDKAKELLDCGENNLQVVSDSSGYNDINYFSKCFKKKYGISPSKYLEMKRTINGI